MSNTITSCSHMATATRLLSRTWRDTCPSMQMQIPSIVTQHCIRSSRRPLSTSRPTRQAMALNLPRWLEKNNHLLQPPVNNYCVYHPSSPDTSGLTVMVVGGPNARTDYHINETPEFFYQHKGSMLLKTVDTSKTPHEFVDIPIHENSLYLLPANTPHNPVRFADTVGVVLEQARPAESIDKMRWYCKNPDCGQVVHEAAFHCNDLGSQIKNAVQAFEKNMDARTCKNCGTVNDSKPAPGEIKQPPRFPD